MIDCDTDSDEMRFSRILTKYKNPRKVILYVLVVLITLVILIPLVLLAFDLFKLIRGDSEQESFNDVSQLWSQQDLIDILDEERSRIRFSLRNISFPENSPFRSVEEFLPEEGGRQLILLIVGYWRSGSTFLGDVLSSHPSTYYVYEPLRMWKAQQIRGPPDSEEAIRVLRKLIESNYTDLESFLHLERRSNLYIKEKNLHLRRVCEKHKIGCFQPEFLSKFVNLFPFKVFKITRLRLSLVEVFLRDPRYNVRVVLLVRDPRGLMSSRRLLKWCSLGPDCYQPAHFCSDLISDYATALRFLELYRKRFKVVRYEDLALSPKEKTQDILHFAGLNLHESVLEFLQTHTHFKSGSAYATFRNSTDNAIKWREDPALKTIINTQSNCEIALKLWGYNLIKHFNKIKTFNPLDHDFMMTKRSYCND